MDWYWWKHPIFLDFARHLGRAHSLTVAPPHYYHHLYRFFMLLWFLRPGVKAGEVRLFEAVKRISEVMEANWTLMGIATGRGKGCRLCQ
jgi:hypothetical protein